ncbi:MAG: hypothetical protein ACRDHZ_03355 [Ktedonobacteraceae bacterium]
MEPRTILIGKGTLLVNSEDFINGYQAGHLAYQLQASTTIYTNTRVTEIMMEKLESMEFKEQYSIGFVVGWIATFATKGTTAGGGARRAACLNKGSTSSDHIAKGTGMLGA